MSWRPAELNQAEGLVVYTFLLDFGKGLLALEGLGLSGRGGQDTPCNCSRTMEETEAELLHHHIRPEGAYWSDNFATFAGLSGLCRDLL